MNIKDPEVHRLARELAARRGTSATGAVREALREALAGEEARRSGTAQRLLELAAQSRTIDQPLLTDAELYDGHGLPR
ncbi:MAG: type II toxin-antitoxin system VapB family antitoxin [Actinobacteria bacterium]|nr:type II toxin-antitoxin system VapB family antitoxin [Actinomycetota bacterium]